MSNAFIDRYPVSHTLEDGAKISCSVMSSEDRDALKYFISQLRRYDLAYLQVDITKSDVLERWLDTIDQGRSVCICAYDPKQLVGYASVQLASRGQPSGEIRVNISQGYRSRGLGRVLISEILHVARRLNLELITARMLSDQHGARAAFERLGFARQEVLPNYVKDAKGTGKDLLVMATEITSH